jgi:DNA-directed RNA polymerase specialized sigma24 family protein
MGSDQFSLSSSATSPGLITDLLKAPLGTVMARIRRGLIRLNDFLKEER